MIVWRPRREDFLPLLALAALPLFIALPQLLGLFPDDPRLYLGDLAQNVQNGWLSGRPHLDGNIAYTTQALGRLAATDWRHGLIAWWNPYSGVGLPLAAMYQPAAFSPPTLLLLLPGGMIWRHLCLQLLAGWGCYAWLRQFGLGWLAALTAGLLFAQNGTFNALGDAPSGPVAFFPWVLFGVEWAIAKAARREAFGWQPFALALALMLLAGFPETAYICALFALLWAALRAPSMGLAWRLLLGGTVALALAAPQILPFFEFLPLAFIGGHTGAFAHAALLPQLGILSLLAPFVNGGFHAYGQWTPPNAVGEHSFGGYVDLLQLGLAAYGLWRRRDALSWGLLAWILLALNKSFGIPPLAAAWNLIPGISTTLFFRYSPPTWELALITLAAFGIDALTRDTPPRTATCLTATVFSAGLAILLGYILWLWPHEPIPGVHAWMLASLAWASFTSVLALALLLRAPGHWRAPALAALLVLDATTMFLIPTLSNRRGGTIDTAAISFLQQNLGLQRFYTLGPIAPNYGAYFEIASINDMYLPADQLWAQWVTANLDSAANPLIFSPIAIRPPSLPGLDEELRRNLAAYEETGVKYVVTPAGQNPFIAPPPLGQGAGLLPLAPGQSIQGTLPPVLLTNLPQLTTLGVLIYNNNNTADGILTLNVCAAGQCVSGSANLAGLLNDAVLWVTLPRPLAIAPQAAVTYSISHTSGSSAVALWTTKSGPAFQLPPAANLPRQVYADGLMDIYQLPEPKPYFEAPGCVLQPQSRTRLLANCAAPAQLIRRELFCSGWQARINGTRTPITEQNGLFQALNLPAGQSIVTFAYAPPYIAWAWLLMACALAALNAQGVGSSSFLKKRTKKLL
jgi:hypothetical protein